MSAVSEDPLNVANDRCWRELDDPRRRAPDVDSGSDALQPTASERSSTVGGAMPRAACQRERGSAKPKHVTAPWAHPAEGS